MAVLQLRNDCQSVLRMLGRQLFRTVLFIAFDFVHVNVTYH